MSLLWLSHQCHERGGLSAAAPAGLGGGTGVGGGMLSPRPTAGHELPGTRLPLAAGQSPRRWQRPPSPQAGRDGCGGGGWEVGGGDTPSIPPGCSTQRLPPFPASPSPATGSGDLHRRPPEGSGGGLRGGLHLRGPGEGRGLRTPTPGQRVRWRERTRSGRGGCVSPPHSLKKKKKGREAPGSAPAARGGGGRGGAARCTGSRLWERGAAPMHEAAEGGY